VDCRSLELVLELSQRIAATFQHPLGLAQGAIKKPQGNIVRLSTVLAIIGLDITINPKSWEPLVRSCSSLSTPHVANLCWINVG
jgi:hypothetical protein